MADEPIPLPFKVGQRAESKSFSPGFRGAWFRCLIKRIDREKGYLRYAVKYFDFTDEKNKRIKVYQKNPRGVKDNRHLMLRPAFPQIFKESQLPEINAISKVAVVVNDVWKEGDLVDWWTDACFWSGRVSQVLDDGMFEVELLPPPLGEGRRYEVHHDDLRPSLDWSLLDGWTVPTVGEPENFRPCAQIIHPVNQVHPVNEVTKDVEGNAGSSVEFTASASLSSFASDSLLPPSERSDESELPVAKELLEEKPLSAATTKEDPNAPEIHTHLDVADTEAKRISSSNSVSSSHVRDAIDAQADTAVENDLHSTSYLRCMHSDTLEALAMDWEEMLCKLKWLKAILKSGIPPPTPSWDFVEQDASNTNTRG